VAFYRGADCCVLVYDITDTKSFESLNGWKEEFLVQAAPQKADDFPFVCIGNKLDLAQQQRQVNEGRVKSWCDTNNDMPQFEASAKDATNVENAFKEIAKKALKAEAFNQPFVPKPVVVDGSSNKQSGGCCK
jgi:Ras-related protein Rab-7A